MLYLFIALLIFILLLLKKDYKNRFIWVFSLSILGMLVSLFGVSLHLLKWSNYVSFHNVLGEYDYRVFLWVQDFFSLSLFEVSDIMLAGITIYLLSMNLMGNLLRRRFCNGIKSVKIFSLVFTAFSFLYFFTHLSKFGMWLFLELHRRGNGSAALPFLVGLDFLFNLLTAFSLGFPIYLLIRMFLRSRVSLLKKQYLSQASSLLALNCFFYLQFFVSSASFSFCSLLNTGFYREVHFFPENLHFYFTILPVVMIAATAVNGLILSKYNLHDTIERFRIHLLKKNFDQYNQQVRGILHSQKNILFSIQLLAMEELRLRPESACAREILSITRENIGNAS